MKKDETYRHKGLRKQLVNELRSKGITDEAVLEAIGKVKRHLFLNTAFEEWAYKDTAFPIESGQTISQPYTVAVQSSLLEVKKNDRILEIGTGSGYQACVLEELGANVYSLERDEVLYKTATKRLKSLGYLRTRTFLRDGFRGLPDRAPFDKIIVTAAAPNLPQTLLDQLKIGGILVIPVDEGDCQTMKRILRVAEDKFEAEAHGRFSFVPFLEGIRTNHK